MDFLERLLNTITWVILLMFGAYLFFLTTR